MFETLSPQAPDPLLSLIRLYNDDPRSDKIDLGVGVYRTADGATPVFAAVKAAEEYLVKTQPSKAYLGPEGDLSFVAALRPYIFGADFDFSRVAGLQTPGGTGALRLAAELASSIQPGKRVWLGTPSWPIHDAIFRATGLDVQTYSYFDVTTQQVRFDQLMEALNQAGRGDLFLLHGCCHNPTGADLTLDQWREIAAVLKSRGVMPLIDLAYQGLGAGMEEDAQGVRIVLNAVPEAMLAYSCDKNFGLYRERTGAFYAITTNADTTVLAMGNLCTLARTNWSMPPDHGAAVVRVILEDKELTALWKSELDGMRARLLDVRATLAQNPDLVDIRNQNGLFSMLRLDKQAIEHLRVEHGIYMAGSGRINLAGLSEHNVDAFSAALRSLVLVEA